MLGVWPGPAEIPGILPALSWPVGPGATQGHYLALWPSLWVRAGGAHLVACMVVLNCPRALVWHLGFLGVTSSLLPIPSSLHS